MTTRSTHPLSLIFDDLIAVAVQSFPYHVFLPCHQFTFSKFQRTPLLHFSIPTLQHIYLKMNRLFAASLLVVLVSILLATPALAMGPDPSRRLQSKVGYASTTCSDTISYIFHIDVAGCLAPCPVHVHVETHCFTFLPSCALPFLDSHQFASSSLETQTNLSPPRAPRRPRGRKLRRLQRLLSVASTTANAS